MAFHTNSFFVGVGTVLATIAVGFGGGLMMSDALVGKSEMREPNKLEQRAAEAKVQPPLQVAVATPAPAQPQASPTIASTIQPDIAPPPPAPRLDVVAPAQPVEQPAQPIAQRVRAPEDATAMVREGELRKYEARKRIERRKFAERRREQRQADELDRMAERVRQIELERQPRLVTREFVNESPVMRVFEND